jgi:hypothetical protein
MRCIVHLLRRGRRPRLCHLRPRRLRPRTAAELLEVLAKLAAGHRLAIVLLAGGFLQNHPKRGRLLLHRGMGQVAAADSFCTNVHHDMGTKEEVKPNFRTPPR